MSATGRGNPRNERDFYPTPAALVGAALDHIDLTGAIGHSLTILDPGAGRGEWGKAARRRWPDARIIGLDLVGDNPDRSVYDEWHAIDFLTWAGTVPDDDRPDLIIGNPPYNLAESFIRSSIAITQSGGRVVFLLRLNFLAGIKRGGCLWHEHKPDRVSVCTARPSFSGNGRTDATEYAIYLWRVGHAPSDTILDWLHWQPDRRARGLGDGKENGYERQTDRATLYSGAA